MSGLWVPWGLTECYGWTLVPDEPLQGFRGEGKRLETGQLVLDTPHPGLPSCPFNTHQPEGALRSTTQAKGD